MAGNSKAERIPNNESSDDSLDIETCKCDICDIVVTEDDDAIACEICEHWYHIKCEELPKGVYDFMATEAGSRKLSWYCKHCSRGSVKLFSRLLKLERAHDETREAQIKLVSEIKEVKNDMDIRNSDITARLNNLEGEIDAVKSALDGEGEGY